MINTNCPRRTLIGPLDTIPNHAVMPHVQKFVADNRPELAPESFHVEYVTRISSQSGGAWGLDYELHFRLCEITNRHRSELFKLNFRVEDPDSATSGQMSPDFAANLPERFATEFARALGGLSQQPTTNNQQ